MTVTLRSAAPTIVPGRWSSCPARSPLPGERLHLQLQAVDLFSEVLLEEPVVQLSRLAAALSLAQSGCEPHELVIKNKSHGGEEDQVHKHKVKQPGGGGGGRNYEGEKDGEETNSKEKQDEGEAGRREADFLFFFFYSSTTVYSH